MLCTKLVKGLENQESCFMEIKADILSLTQKVESHTTMIKQPEVIWPDVSDLELVPIGYSS